MRKFIAAAALLFGIFFITVRVAEVQEIANTLQGGKPVFLLIAAGIEVIWVFNLGASYWSIYRALGIEERIENLMVLSMAANFVNVIAPSGGMGGIAVFVTDAHRNGRSGGKVTVAGVLFVLFEYAAFLGVLALGLLVLVRRNHLTSVEVVASGVLVVVAVVMAGLMILGARSEKALGSVLAWAARSVNRLLWSLLHRPYLSEQRAHEFAHDAASSLRQARSQPRRLLAPALLALSSKLLLISILLMTFFAFGVPYSLGTIIAGFSVGYLFLIVSPTPAGIGMVEGALTLALNSLSVPLGDAAILTLAYRGVTFWLPLLIGMLAFRQISTREKISPAVRAD